MTVIFRNRQSTDGKYIAKLSLEELNSFYEQVAELPCIIKERKMLKVCRSLSSITVMFNVLKFRLL